MASTRCTRFRSDTCVRGDYHVAQLAPYEGHRHRLFLMAVYLIFRYWILGYRYARSIRQNPQYGKSLQWTLSPEGVLAHSDDGEMRMKWSGFYETVTTPEGFLLYLQKEIYYWIPTAGFSSADDVGHVQTWLRDCTNNRVVD